MGFKGIDMEVKLRSQIEDTACIFPLDDIEEVEDEPGVFIVKLQSTPTYPIESILRVALASATHSRSSNAASIWPPYTTISMKISTSCGSNLYSSTVSPLPYCPQPQNMLL